MSTILEIFVPRPVLALTWPGELRIGQVKRDFSVRIAFLFFGSHFITACGSIAASLFGEDEKAFGQHKDEDGTEGGQTGSYDIICRLIHCPDGPRNRYC